MLCVLGGAELNLLILLGKAACMWSRYYCQPLWRALPFLLRLSRFLLVILWERVCDLCVCIYTHSGLWVSLSMWVKFSLLHCVLCFPLIDAHQSSPTARWAFIIMTLFIYTALNLVPLANTPSSSSAQFRRTVINAGVAGRTPVRIQRCSVVWAE